jgi:natural resistance-associated macrophage protein 2
LLHYLEAKKLEAFFAALIATMAVCFFINFGYAAPGATDIAQGFIPYSQAMRHFWQSQAVGIIGAVIVPHNIYLHSALAIESVVALLVSFLRRTLHRVPLALSCSLRLTRSRGG